MQTNFAELQAAILASANPSYLGMILTKSANSFAEAPKSDLMGNDFRQSLCRRHRRDSKLANGVL
jgi:hypothetical protein